MESDVCVCACLCVCVFVFCRCGSHVIEEAYRAANVESKKSLVEGP